MVKRLRAREDRGDGWMEEWSGAVKGEVNKLLVSLDSSVETQGRPRRRRRKGQD